MFYRYFVRIANIFIMMGLVFVLTSQQFVGAESNKNLKEIDSYVLGQMKDLDIPGVAIGIVRGDQIVYTQGYGVADDAGRAMTPGTADEAPARIAKGERRILIVLDAEQRGQQGAVVSHRHFVILKARRIRSVLVITEDAQTIGGDLTSAGRHALRANDNNLTKALRAVLQEAIERQRPPGDRKNTAPEWLVYNILDFRFVQGQRVFDIARRLSMSESDLYRKQRTAVSAVAKQLLRLDQSKWIWTAGAKAGNQLEGKAFFRTIVRIPADRALKNCRSHSHAPRRAGRDRSGCLDRPDARI